MFANKFNTDFDSLQKFVSNLYSNYSGDPKQMVPRESQEKEIALLKETLMNNERFFFVVNVPEFKIEELSGIAKWLGYDERDFTLKQYWDRLMHPSRKASLSLISQQLYATLSKGIYTLEFMVQRFATQVPLKHRDGHYVLAKKTSSVFQYDKNNRLLGYIDEFTIISHEYDGTPMNPVMYNSNGEREMIKEKEIMTKVLERFLGMKVFSAGELQAMRVLAYNPQTTQAQMAAHLGLSVHTINEYSKRFLAKAREFYGIDFKTTLEAALYLKREGLL